MNSVVPSISCPRPLTDERVAQPPGAIARPRLGHEFLSPIDVVLRRDVHKAILIEQRQRVLVQEDHLRTN